jgi:DNA mismatch repair protein MutS2
LLSLYEKSIQTLELPAVLRQLASHAASDEAKENALALRPAAYFEDAVLTQKQTSAARHMTGLRPAPSFSGLKRVGDSLIRADLGGVLNTRELLDIAACLRVARSVKAYGASGKEEKNCLDSLFRLLEGNKFLEDKITGAIISEEEISDNASAEFASLRRQLRIASGKVRETLNKYVSSPSHTKYLQDALITQRGGRFVVPVKAEHRGDVPGLVHDVSSSGATLFIEPMAVVTLNNEIRETEAKEKKEIERILAELSADCASFREGILNDYDALVTLDGIFARAKLSYEMEAEEPALNQSGRLSLIASRHPLIPRKSAVPITVRLGTDFDTLVITGPNTGGKTVTLKTIGLLSLMAACGLHIPAGSGSEVPIWDAIYADIGDEQSIEQSLSTFSSHMTNIVGILGEIGEKSAGQGTLALFDELGAGTDPVEGAALAVSIIQHIRRLGAKVAATTHYAELKTFALTTDGVENASCEFDVETLRPTYRLLIGIPGKSNAFAISSRLGLPEEIIEAAKGHVSTENAAFEDILTRLEVQRQAMESDRAAAARFLAEARENDRKSAETRALLDKQREKATERASAEARGIIEQTRREADEILRELGRIKAQARTVSDEELTAVRTRLNRAEDAARPARETAPEEAPAPITRPLKAGDTVQIISMGTKATVIEPPDKDSNVLALAGMLKIKVPLSDLALTEEAAPKKPVSSGGTAARRTSASLECDLRGMTGEEALLSMDLFLDGAVLSGLNAVTVIHGKGTGALRQAVHNALRHHKQVKSFRLGRFGEGENGVTIVELK